ncbi:hypothetical protein TNCV_2541011 [Trichonephila clavipes]|nr:hypothetical protein TNCV_2541011 [Trichonephila clavipes]
MKTNSSGHRKFEPRSSDEVELRDSTRVSKHFHQANVWTMSPKSHKVHQYLYTIGLHWNQDSNEHTVLTTSSQT